LRETVQVPFVAAMPLLLAAPLLTANVPVPTAPVIEPGLEPLPLMILGK